MGLTLTSPDHTTLSRRNRDVDVPLPTKAHGSPIHLIVDSTGLEILGDGEWHRHKHETKTRRGWRKLHVGVDGEGFMWRFSSWIRTWWRRGVSAAMTAQA